MTPTEIIAKEVAKAKRESLVLTMAQQLRTTAIAAGAVREHAFHHGRKWRFDFAWPSKLVALEVEGGTYTGGRHTRGDGYRKDVEKYNVATINGWRVIRADSKQVKSGEALRWIVMALAGIQ